MVKIDAVSATSIPLWLLVSTIIFVALRCGLSITEKIHPPKATNEIKWRTPDQITEADRHGSKLIFYNFTADWCDPCIQMNRTTFLSKDVVNQLNEEFIPVKVIDRKREDGKNTAQVQELEDAFSVQAFPTMVVAVASGTKVSDQLGLTNTQAMRRYLLEALTVSAYYSGKEQLIASDIIGAAKSFDDFLARAKWQHWRCAYSAIFDSIAHRTLGFNDKADKVLQEALTRVHDHTFPYPIIEYLAGRKTFDQLLKNASENKTNRMLCYAYSGMNSFAKKDYDDATSKFEWVLANGVDKDSFEYRIADRWLERTKEILSLSGRSWDSVKHPTRRKTGTNPSTPVMPSLPTNAVPAGPPPPPAE